MNSEQIELIHDEQNQRFVGKMDPSDAFVDYSWQGERMILTHIEVDRSLRGSGVGANFAIQVLTSLQDSPIEIRLTCPFLRQMARTRNEWRRKFMLENGVSS